MSEFLSRTELLLGADNVKKLKDKCVAIFGLGGVGSYCAEAIVRSGVGKVILVDNDVVSVSNLNRQLFALNSTIGKMKVEVAKQRFLDINDKLVVQTYPIFFSNQTKNEIDLSGVDYIVDCIDYLDGKVLLAKTAKLANKSIISCLSTGNKLEPTSFYVCDVYSTTICPIAKIMRSKLKKEGIDSLKVVYSKEAPIKKVENKVIPSIAFVPSVAGMILASETIKDLIKE